jgi:hypothetical protein
MSSAGESSAEKSEVSSLGSLDSPSSGAGSPSGVELKLLTAAETKAEYGTAE